MRFARALSIVQVSRLLTGFYTFATSANGQPKVRTVVHRGFLNEDRTGRIDEREPESCILIFTTDTRSDKVREITANPSVQIAWYIDQSRMQVCRVLTSSALVGMQVLSAQSRWHRVYRR